MYIGKKILLFFAYFSKRKRKFLSKTGGLKGGEGVHIEYVGL